LLVGPTGILLYNDAIRTIFQSIGGDGLGRSIFDVLPEAAGFYEEALARCSEGEAPWFRDQALRTARHGTSETAWFDLDFTPVLESDGAHNAVLVGAFETTEKVRALRASQRSDEQLQLALDASGMIGIWD